MSPSRYKWAVVVIAVLGSLVPVLDTVEVSFALAHLSREFDASIAQVQWVITGYLLAVGVVIAGCGYLADRFGIKRVFLASLVIFTLSAMGSGMASDLNVLIVFRVLQGIGGGALGPLSAAMVFRVVPHEERGKFMGIVSAPVMMAAALGPILSGYLVEYVSWRWIFFLNAPLGLVAIILGLAWLREQKLPTTGGFDVRGLALSAAGFALLLFALSKAPSRGWEDPLIIGTLVASLATLTAFVVIALRIRHPIVDLRLFAQRGFALNNVVMLFSSFTLFGGSFLLPLFFQQVQGRGPMEAGLLMMPVGMTNGIMLPIIGRAYDEHGPRWIMAGGMVAFISTMAMFALVGINIGVLALIPLLIVRGIAAAMVSTMSTAALNEVKPNEMARASALLGASRQISTGMIVAILATILAERGSALRESAVRDLPAGSEAFAAAIRHANLLAFHEVFLIAATAAVPALVAALMLRSGRRRAMDREAAPATEPVAVEG